MIQKVRRKVNKSSLVVETYGKKGFVVRKQGEELVLSNG